MKGCCGAESGKHRLARTPHNLEFWRAWWAALARGSWFMPQRWWSGEQTQRKSGPVASANPPPASACDISDRLCRGPNRRYWMACPVPRASRGAVSTRDGCSMTRFTSANPVPRARRSSGRSPRSRPPSATRAPTPVLHTLATPSPAESGETASCVPRIGALSRARPCSGFRPCLPCFRAPLFPERLPPQVALASWMRKTGMRARVSRERLAVDARLMSTGRNVLHCWWLVR